MPKMPARRQEERDVVNPLVPDTTPGPPFTYTAPLTTTPHFDNPLNPRGIPSSMCDGAADAQATTDQKTQNPTPQRQPINATTFPDPSTNLERVSAGQNRKPPTEIIP
jgi:hypothetical protein